jgi:prophage maintenance system killer protein
MYPTDASRLAAFLYFAVKSHMCWTGAKRVAVALALAMLDISECWLNAEPGELTALVTRIAATHGDEVGSVLPQVESWCRERLVCDGEEG